MNSKHFDMDGLYIGPEGPVDEPKRNSLVAYEDEPTVEGGVHHPYTAFNQGFDAAYDHQHPASACPYPEGRERTWWMDGHACATKEIRGAA